LNLDKLVAQLTKHEGKSLKPYVDTVGKVTIGVGRNLTDRGITEEECDLLLSTDIKIATLFCHAYDWFDTLDDVRQAVFADMIFNLGPTRFAGFKKMIAAVEQRNWQSAADHALDSQWAVQVGSRAIRLAQMLRTGEWP